jgi:RND family efflux transporter MFP subunit
MRYTPSVALWALVLLLSACSRPAPVEVPIRSVKVLTVGASPLQGAYEFAGEVRARVESQLSFRVAGQMVRRQAEVGQRVTAGQVLAEIDPKDYKLSADAARAAVAAAQTNLDISAADFKRYSGLKDQNFISGADLERREATLKAAQAQLDQAKAQLAAQGNQAGYARLLADAPGIITAVLAEPGQVVAAGTPVFRIAQDGARDVVFAVPEDKLAAIHVGDPVEVRRWTENRVVTAKVREVGASADPATRTFPVKVQMPLNDAPALGATVYVVPQSLNHATVQAIKLPTSALKQDGKSTAVWVLDKSTMTVKSQPIDIATADGNDAVVSGGLKPGDLVVSAGVHVLQPGQKVTIYQEKYPEKLPSAQPPAVAGTPAK